MLLFVIPLPRTTPRRSPIPVPLACVLCLAAVAITACRGDLEVSDQNLRRISVEAVADALEQEPDRVLLIDVRSESRFADGHLPGAIHLPLPELPPSEEQREGVRRIVVYGKNWTDTLAPAAAKKLIAAGIKNVQVFRGGVGAWTDAGRPLETP